MRHFTALLMVVLFLPAENVWGLGGDHPPPSTPTSSSAWPAGMAELVNIENRVHGFFVNSTDVYFLQGNTAAFNTALVKWGQLPNTEVKILLHVRKLAVKSPWDKLPRELRADWKVTTAPHDEAGNALKSGKFQARLDVWLSDEIQLSELKVPASIEISSGGEIERFVKEHSKLKDK